MLNLLINLKKYRNSANESAGSLLVFSGFVAGSVLFWLFGAELYNSGIIDFSIRNFCIAFSVALLFVMLSAFSQLGPVQIAVGDAAFEFIVCCFAFSGLSDFMTLKSVSVLCLKLFVIILFSMFISQKANSSSIRLLSSLKSNKKNLGCFLINLAILICLILILLIICLNAF